MTASTYRNTPFGEALGPGVWISRFDTKFNAEGLYHTRVVFERSPETDAMVQAIQADAQAGYDRCMADLLDKGANAAERKKWTVYEPIEAEEDDQGTPTGRWIASFKQNRIIHFKDGATKEVSIAIKDASGKADVSKEVWAGSIIRVSYAPRDNKIVASKQAGCRLDFAAIQVKKLNSAGMGGSGGPSFGSVDDGYLDERDQGAFDPAEGPKPLSGSDY